MTPLKQRNRHQPEEGVFGDCHRAAIASVLDLSLDDVPHFFDKGVSGEIAARSEEAWLAARGLAPVRVACNETLVLGAILDAAGKINPGACYLLSGKSKSGCNHTVVCRDEQIVHDPSQDDVGIIGPCEEGHYLVTFLKPAAGAA